MIKNLKFIIKKDMGPYLGSTFFNSCKVHAELRILVKHFQSQLDNNESLSLAA